MSDNTLTCGMALVRLLETYGVDTVFGVPGVHTLELYRGLVGSPVRHVLTRNEQGASFMADGYARATGKPGVCFVITGPGVTNASTGIAEAYADSVPLLCISSVGPVETLGKGWGELHEMDDQRASTAPFTAFSATALTAEEVPGLIHRAFAVFSSGRPRPVHIEVPLDVLGHAVDAQWQPVGLPERAAPAEAAVSEAAKLLNDAAKPLIFAGGGAIPASGALSALAEKLAAPVLMTTAGNGVVAESHALSLGPRMTSDAVRRYAMEADVVLAIGTEWATFEGSLKGALDVAGTVIRVDIDARKLVDRVPAKVAICADSGKTAQALLNTVKDAGDPARKAAADLVKIIRADSDAALPALNQKHMRIGKLTQEILPDDAVLVTDMTQIAYSFRANLGWEKPRQFLHPKGFGTLGYGLPAAVGAQVGRPDVPVVIFAGDGGLMYTVEEMLTAADEKANIVLVVWHNNSLADIRDFFVMTDIDPIAVSPLAPDFVAMAKSMHWDGVRATTPEEYRAALSAALAGDKPTLIEIHESDEY
ncbi:5-guanidino-2-oxopentanoate decarboxylase [Roseovarius sp. 2305UL8-3]|uniref:5-guanidino-2-oxopentanoate decarboxylase n=1 Tax=Roseovarius conchicola TaxID=3121636 RepID=UPI0035293C66